MIHSLISLEDSVSLGRFLSSNLQQYSLDASHNHLPAQSNEYGICNSDCCVGRSSYDAGGIWIAFHRICVECDVSRVHSKTSCNSTVWVRMVRHLSDSSRVSFGAMHDGYPSPQVQHANDFSVPWLRSLNTCCFRLLAVAKPYIHWSQM